jgi:hypothetical protein
VDDVALVLAGLRAGRTGRFDERLRGRAASRAATAGRRLVDLDDGEVTLGWEDGCAPEPDAALPVHRLSPLPLLTFAVCLRLCWTDLHDHPYPGATSSRAAVLDVLRRLGADPRHTKAALNHDLPATGLVTVDGDQVRLGPAVASLPPAQVSLLRRSHDLLPAEENQ